MPIEIFNFKQYFQFSSDAQRLEFDKTNEKLCKLNIVHAMGKDTGIWNLTVALCQKEKRKQHYTFQVTIGIATNVDIMVK